MNWRPVNPVVVVCTPLQHPNQFETASKPFFVSLVFGVCELGSEHNSSARSRTAV